MRPRAILKHHSNSYPFDERTLDLTTMVRVGRAVAKCKPQSDNAIFDCKVLSRNHAVIWFENGKFFIKDTCSSNGTFINNNRLSPANEDSQDKEIHSNDIIQFGVEVVNNTSKITHGCIILRIKLFYPNGSEVSRTTSMFNIPTANMLPPYYSYTQMIEREQMIYQKLNSIEEVLEEAHLLADTTLNAKKHEEQLIKQIELLQNNCDEKTNYAQQIESDMQLLKDNCDEKINYAQKLQCDIEELGARLINSESRLDKDSDTIRSLKLRIKEKNIEVEHLQKRLDRMITKNHRLVTTLFLLLCIVLVIGGFDMIVMFMRLI